jgi:hypothetical protein
MKKNGKKDKKKSLPNGRGLFGVTPKKPVPDEKPRTAREQKKATSGAEKRLMGKLI